MKNITEFVLFNCDNCNRSFNRSNNFQKHLKVCCMCNDGNHSDAKLIIEKESDFVKENNLQIRGSSGVVRSSELQRIEDCGFDISNVKRKTRSQQSDLYRNKSVISRITRSGNLIKTTKSKRKYEIMKRKINSKVNSTHNFNLHKPKETPQNVLMTGNEIIPSDILINKRRSQRSIIDNDIKPQTENITYGVDFSDIKARGSRKKSLSAVTLTNRVNTKDILDLSFSSVHVDEKIFSTRHSAIQDDKIPNPLNKMNHRLHRSLGNDTITAQTTENTFSEIEVLPSYTRYKTRSRRSLNITTDVANDDVEDKNIINVSIPFNSDKIKYKTRSQRSICNESLIPCTPENHLTESKTVEDNRGSTNKLSTETKIIRIHSNMVAHNKKSQRLRPTSTRRASVQDFPLTTPNIEATNEPKIPKKRMCLRSIVDESLRPTSTRRANVQDLSLISHNKVATYEPKITKKRKSSRSIVDESLVKKRRESLRKNNIRYNNNLFIVDKKENMVIENKDPNNENNIDTESNYKNTECFANDGNNNDKVTRKILKPKRRISNILNADRSSKIKENIIEPKESAINNDVILCTENSSDIAEQSTLQLNNLSPEYNSVDFIDYDPNVFNKLNDTDELKGMNEEIKLNVISSITEELPAIVSSTDIGIINNFDESIEAADCSSPITIGSSELLPPSDSDITEVISKDLKDNNKKSLHFEALEAFNEIYDNELKELLSSYISSKILKNSNVSKETESPMTDKKDQNLSSLKLMEISEIQTNIIESFDIDTKLFPNVGNSIATSDCFYSVTEGYESQRATKPTEDLMNANFSHAITVETNELPEFYSLMDEAIVLTNLEESTETKDIYSIATMIESPELQYFIYNSEVVTNLEESIETMDLSTISVASNNSKEFHSLMGKCGIMETTDAIIESARNIVSEEDEMNLAFSYSITEKTIIFEGSQGSLDINDKKIEAFEKVSNVSLSQNAKNCDKDKNDIDTYLSCDGSIITDNQVMGHLNTLSESLDQSNEDNLYIINVNDNLDVSFEMSDNQSLLSVTKTFGESSSHNNDNDTEYTSSEIIVKVSNNNITDNKQAPMILPHSVEYDIDCVDDRDLSTDRIYVQSVIGDKAPFVMSTTEDAHVISDTRLENMITNIALSDIKSVTPRFGKKSKSVDGSPAKRRCPSDRLSATVSYDMIEINCVVDHSCSYKAESMTNLKAHISQCHPTITTFKRKTVNNLTNKDNEISSELTFCCKKCDQKFDSMSQLQTHELLHNLDVHNTVSSNIIQGRLSTEEQRVVTEITVNKVSRKRSKMTKDISNVKSKPEPKIYRCEKCLNDYSTQKAYNTHMRLHSKMIDENVVSVNENTECVPPIVTNKSPLSGTRSYTCEKCPEKPVFLDHDMYFYHCMSRCKQSREAQEKQLQQHFPNMYGCGMCGLMFKTTTRLNTHKEEMHPNGRPKFVTRQ